MTPLRGRKGDEADGRDGVGTGPASGRCESGGVPLGHEAAAFQKAATAPDGAAPADRGSGMGAWEVGGVNVEHRTFNMER